MVWRIGSEKARERELSPLRHLALFGFFFRGVKSSHILAHLRQSTGISHQAA